MSFANVLQETITPMTLTTGVGLVMLCLTNRFIHCTDRVRELIKKQETEGYADEPDLPQEIEILFRRARYLRHALFMWSLAVLFAAFMVACSLTAHLFDMNTTYAASVCLVLAMACLVLGSIFLTFEVYISMSAMRLIVEREPDYRGRRVSEIYHD